MNYKEIDEQLEYQQADAALLQVACRGKPPMVTNTLRVKKKIATKWLLENKCVVVDGNVRYLQIRELGLGICEVDLQPIGKVNTFVVKSFLL